jgi:DNA-binding XRE family transcriptional regulator
MVRVAQALRRLPLTSRDAPNPDRRTPNPSRLTLARKRRGYTKTKLAGLIGVDLRAVVAYEAGEYPPAEDAFSKIQSVLGFPEEFFLVMI